MERILANRTLIRTLYLKCEPKESDQSNYYFWSGPKDSLKFNFSHHVDVDVNGWGTIEGSPEGLDWLRQQIEF